MASPHVNDGRDHLNLLLYLNGSGCRHDATLQGIQALTELVCRETLQKTMDLREVQHPTIYSSSGDLQAIFCRQAWSASL